MDLQKREIVRNKKFINTIRHTVFCTLRSNLLIEKNDSIIIGVSGGKDSLALLEILGMYKKYLAIPFKLFAAHIKIKEFKYEIEPRYFESLCNIYDIEFIYREIVFENKNPEKKPCFICSWNRRKELFNLSVELNCNKIALGHHLDDAIETMMMNMIYHGSYSALPEKLKMFDGRIHLIRPLLYLTNSEMERYAKIRMFPEMKYECEFSNITSRKEMAKFIETLELMNKPAKINMFNAMSNIYPEYLPLGIRL